VKHSHFVCGSFEKGVGQGELGEAVASTSKVCKYSIKFSLIHVLGLFPSRLCMPT
jgi:hypothetical protein